MQAVKEDTWIPTVCNMCYNACTIQVHRVDGVLRKVAGVAGAPPNHGVVCAKSNAQIQSAYSPHRVTRPMVRTNPRKGLDEDPRWREISWSEAMDLMCDRLKRVRDDDPRKLIVLSFDGQSYLPIRSFASGFGTNNYTVGAAGYFCGNGLHAVSYSINGCVDIQVDLEHTDYCMLFGCQYGFVAMSHAIPATKQMADARQRGMKLVSVDPVLSNSASKADEWIAIRPGTDAALALGMIHLLLNELKIYDREFLRRYTNATYLVGPDQYYARDPKSGKPLVWNVREGRAAAYDACPPEDAALDGTYRIGSVDYRPALVVFAEHVSKLTPERVEEITTVPAATVRRLAKEFGQAASIGSTITIDGHELPHRPAVAFWYRGVSQHKHGMENGFAVALLNVMVGAVDVPGGLLNANAAGPFGFPGEGPDGLITPGNPYSHMKAQWPPREVKAPESLELIELFPLSCFARAVPWLGILEPEIYKVPYQAEVLIHCRANLMSTSADVEKTVEALSKIPFQISFVDFMNETAWHADLVLPDAHSLERLAPFAADPFTTYYATALPGEDWWFAFQQPVKKAAGESRYWVEVLFEAAERIGCLPDVYMAFNVLGHFEEPFSLDPEKKYTWEQICDRWARSRCGAEIGLDYFKKHGFHLLGKRTVKESYPRAFHSGRIPMYFEHFKKAGEQVGAVVEKMSIPWDVTDYQALIDFKPCQAFHRRDGSLYLVNTKVPFYTHTITAENPLLNDLCERNGHVFPVGINPKTARKLGIQQGDAIVLETEWGRRTEATADLREGVHPEVIACVGVLGRRITGDARIRRKGVHFNDMIKFDPAMMDYVSGGLDACVRVKVTRAARAA
ncbi:MAG: molybdopterin-dependent oxidoreductase [Hyphomicrobiales bacterium]|nr:molybdopterin-dependent oxidoreductase [Hyphomicrobiales bacterium]